MQRYYKIIKNNNKEHISTALEELHIGCGKRGRMGLNSSVGES